MKRIVALLFVLVSVASVLGRFDGSYLLEARPDVVTPHLDWAPKYSRGTLRVLFITPALSIREVVELYQRFDIEYGIATVERGWKFGSDGDMYTMRVKGTRAKERKQLMRELLKKEWDVVAIGSGVRWGILPDEIRYRVLKKVSEGTGLVYSAPVFGRDEESRAILKNRTEQADEVVRGVPLVALHNFEEKSSAEIKEKCVATYRIGKGRMVLLRYKVPGGWYAYVGMRGVVTPWISYSDEQLSLYEYYLSLGMKALLWAGGEKWSAEPQLVGLNPDGVKVERWRMPLTLEGVRVVSKEEQPAKLLVRVLETYGKIEDEQVLELALKKGENPVKVTVPVLKRGRHFVDLRLKVGDAISDWGTTFLDVEAKVKLNLETGSSSCERGDSVKAKVSIEGDVPERGKLTVHLEDTFGRILSRKVYRARERRLSLKVGDPLSLVVRVVATLTDEEGVVDRRAVEVVVPRRKFDDFYVQMWGGPSESHPVSRYFGGQLYKYGVDMIHGWIGREEIPRLWAKMNLMADEYVTHFNNRKGTKTIRNPCLTDPKWQKEIAEKLRRHARIGKEYGYFGYSLGDENSLGIQCCQSPTCLEDFREYLKEAYGTLDDLNREWEAEFKKWDDVKPILLEECKKKGNYAPWIDNLRHMESVYANGYRVCADAIRSVHPDARVGYDGSNRLGFPNDYVKLMSFFEYNIVYESPVEEAIVRSFALPGTISSIFWGGYLSQRSKENLRRLLWKSVFHGFNLSAYYTSFGTEGALSSDLRPSEHFLWVAEHIKQIKSGIGKFTTNARRLEDGIGILYSQSSLNISRYINDLGTTQSSMGAFQSGFEDLLFQVRYLPYADLATELRQHKIKLLVLPFAQALSEDEAAAIKNFVRNGGVVVADLAPAVMDEHGKLLRGGRLDELFGISRKKVENRLLKTPVKIDSSFEGVPFRLELAEAAVELGVLGKALGKAGQQGALFINRYGQGLAVLLNFSITVTRSPEERYQIDELLLSVAKLARAEPRLRLTIDGKRVSGINAVFFEREGAVLLCIMPWKKSPMRVGAMLELPQEYCVYKSREGKFLGRIKKLDVPLETGEPVLLALLPSEARIRLKLSRHLRQGDELKAVVNAQGSGTEHIIHFELEVPSGERPRRYWGNIFTKGGRALYRLPLALNEQPGVWRLHAMDALTGLSVTRTFRIKERSK